MLSRSLSLIGKARPLLQIGSLTNTRPFFLTISARKYLPPIIREEISLRKSEHGNAGEGLTSKRRPFAPQFIVTSCVLPFQVHMNEAVLSLDNRIFSLHFALNAAFFLSMAFSLTAFCHAKRKVGEVTQNKLVVDDIKIGGKHV